LLKPALRLPAGRYAAFIKKADGMKNGLVFTLSVIMTVFLISCHSLLKKQNEDCRDSEKQKYFYRTFTNASTSPDYLVFTVIEKQTGRAKEICCESDLLFRAFQNEGFTKRKLNDPFKEYNDIQQAKPCDHKFEFLFKRSLEIIGFYTYEYTSRCADSLTNVISKVKIDSIMNDSTSIGPRSLFKYFKQNDDYRKDINLIHYLTLKGIYCGRDCESGTILIIKVIK
jgi:hypothetical protein